MNQHLYCVCFCIGWSVQGSPSMCARSPNRLVNSTRNMRTETGPTTPSLVSLTTSILRSSAITFVLKVFVEMKC